MHWTEKREVEERKKDRIGLDWMLFAAFPARRDVLFKCERKQRILDCYYNQNFNKFV